MDREAEASPEAVRSFRPIEDYGVIGNCRTIALVGSNGSIDWACMPRIDSPSIFGAILDPSRGGFFRIEPTVPYRVKHAYRPGTHVLETVFETAGGSAKLVDALLVSDAPSGVPYLYAEHEIARVVQGLDGEVPFRVDYVPRPGYGIAAPRLEDRGPLGIHCEHCNGSAALLSDVPLTLLRGRDAASGTFNAMAGEHRHFSFTYTDGGPNVLMPAGPFLCARIDETARYWTEWTRRLSYEGPYQEAVRRSALALKLLTFAPSGAVVAAATTSLPETIGGMRNWDYRYCWPRDASLTMESLVRLGCRQEADAFLSWMIHATRLSHPEIRTIYDVHGEVPADERTLDHLRGYRDSVPVRTGNRAACQLQLDTYGEIIDASFVYERLTDDSLQPAELRGLVALGRTVARRWREPDEGIWEPRDGRAHRTMSKALCWVALDRLCRMVNGRVPVPLELFRRERDAIRRDVEENGYNDEIDSYVSIYGTSYVDASLLLLERYRFEEPTSRRMQSTCVRIREQLEVAPGLLCRYRRPDGMPKEDSAFGIAGFWLVAALARFGAIGEAERCFENLLGYASPLGLYGEEMDAATRAVRGNFPQAFTHVGVIDAALAIERAKRPEERAHEPR